MFLEQVRSARAAGQDASEQCAAKAERTTTFSTHLAREWVLNHLDRHGPTSGEDLVDGMKSSGMQTHDDRCFGPVFSSLVRDERITQYGMSLRRKGHGTAGGVIWRIVR
jgi:hypothetical protein